MRKQNWPTIFAAIGILLLILDTKTAAAGASAGIEMCLSTLIPSLFPFLFLSVLLTASLSGRSVSLLRPMERLLKLPKGAGCILLIGLLGGYPIGAQAVAQAVRNGSISRENGKRMLAFCSNAGPAFLFGIGSRIFPLSWMCWALWMIHITAALLVGWFMPPVPAETATITSAPLPGPSIAVQQAVKSMAMICGWAVVLRVIIAFWERWVFWLLPIWVQTALSGILELANGCCELARIGDLSQRFILCAGILGFGGLCVTMQTLSVCDGVDTSWYFPGKLLQAMFSILLATLVVSRRMALPALAAMTLLSVLLLIFRRNMTKKDSNLPKCIV